MARAAAVLGIAAALVTACERRPSDGPPQSVVAPRATATVAAVARVPSEAPARRKPAAAGGLAILASAASARAVVAGIVGGVAPVDQHGWRAAVRVEQPLRGELGPGATATIAWEELSASRQVRFADGDRVLVVLEPLPTQSLWRRRFPGEEGRGVLVVAAGGEAFLRDPNGPTLDALAHWLAMTERARDGAPGAGRLAALVAAAPPALAREALTFLEGSPARADALGAEGAEPLFAAVRDPGRGTELRAATLRFAVTHRLPGTREAARALAAEPGSPLRADAYRALAALPDGLAPGEAADLVEADDPELRAVGVAIGGPAVTRERCLALLRDDPAPVVRLAAGRALVAREGSAASPDVVRLLDDPDAGVRTGMAETLGALGASAVGPLAAVVDDGSERAALAAVLGLSRTGPAGLVLLASVAKEHRHPAVQAFARLALGEAPGHGHGE